MNNKSIASLPWYDSDVKRHALDQFWHCAAQYLREADVYNVPTELTRDQSLASLWQSPNLILSQCCGPDLLTEKGAELDVVARPVFMELDCQPGYYHSYIVSRTRSPAGQARIAVNSMSSRSGYSALIEWMSLHGIDVSEEHVSGSHYASLKLLKQGVADIAAIDAHTLNQLGIKPDLPVIGKSTEALAPPYVYHRESGIDSDVMFQALAYAAQENGKSIGVSGIVRADRTIYENTCGGNNTFDQLQEM